MEVPNFYEDPRRLNKGELSPLSGSLPTMPSDLAVVENILKQGYEESLKAEARVYCGGMLYSFNTDANSLCCLGGYKAGDLAIASASSIENIRASFNIHQSSFFKLIKQLEAALDSSMPEQQALMNCQKICLGRYVLESPDGEISLRTLLRIRNNDGCAVTYHGAFGFAYQFGNVALTEIVGELAPKPNFYVGIRYCSEAFSEELNLISSLGSSIELYFHTSPSLYPFIKARISSLVATSDQALSIASVIPISIEDQYFGDRHLIEVVQGSKESKFSNYNRKYTDRFIVDTNAGMFFCRLERNQFSGRVRAECRRIE